MTAPEPRVQANECADSDEFPWVQDLDGRWHSRPSGQAWVMDRGDGANAITDCGRWVASVNVSMSEPDSTNDDLCAQCGATS